jgi:1-acyl-sn-glycerol-3-phosphate acyltransferase
MVRNRMSTMALRAAGWRFEGPLPDAPKYVALAFPHTSNWDGLLLLAMARSAGLSMSWMIKSDWFRGPMGPILRSSGAIAVDRSKSHNVVEQMVAEFGRHDRLVLVVPPEGTRSRSEHWRSGFYHIALGAGVPVVPGYLDYGRKRCGLGEPIELTGDAVADMDHIRAFYARVEPTGHNPQDVGPIRLREEDRAAG